MSDTRTKKRRHRLTDLRLSEVSLVDRPANPLATVVLYKRDDSKEMNMSDKTHEQKLADAVAQVEAFTKGNEKLVAEIEFLKKGLADSTTKLATSEAEKAELAKKIPAPVTKIELPKEAQDQINKAVADATAAREELAKLKDAEDSKIHIAKASTYKFLQQKPDEFGLLLKRVAQNKATPEDIGALHTVLAAANSAVEAITKENGTSAGSAISGAAEKLEAIAKAIATDEKVGYAVAYSKALERNQDLYSQYLRERQ